MKIRKDVDLNILKNYGYEYNHNLIYPSYKKIMTYGNTTVIIEIYIHNRIITVNNTKIINKRNINYIKDLIYDNLIDK